MSYRFLRLYSNFSGYIQHFYAARPGLAEKSYAEQYAAMMFDAAERADFYEQELAKYGYETATFVVDAEPMQKQWAREHDVTYDDARWMQAIALAQIEAFQPEVLWASTWLEGFSGEFVREARRRCPGLKLVFGWVGESYPPMSFFREHDFVLSCTLDSVSYMQSQGVPARHLDHAFSPQVLDRLANLPAQSRESIGVGFIGNQTFGAQYKTKRTMLLYDIANQMDFALFGRMSGAMVYERRGPIRYLRRGYYGLLGLLERLRLSALARHLPRYDVWQDIKRRAPYVPYFAFVAERQQPPVYGLEMYRTLQRFKVGLNAHGPTAFASNMRLYDTTGVGTCLLTDWKQNLHELFEPDVEVVSFRGAEEAVEKARYLLKHDDERRAIAAAGQKRTLRDHTYAQRAQQLDQYIREYMRRPGSGR